MADDGEHFTTTEENGWCSRMGNSMIGSLIGFVVFIGSLVAIFWNEGNAVNRAKALEEALSQCTDQTCTYNPGLVGKLVHITCDVNHVDTLEDKQLGVTYAGLSLARKVEMYQWIEESSCHTEKTSTGGERRVCDYSYRSDWVDYYIDSHSFQSPSKTNPPWPLNSKKFVSDNVQVGDYVLRTKLIDTMYARPQDLLLTNHSSYEPSEQVPPTIITPDNTQLCGDVHYYTGDCTTPVVGDMRLSYTVTNATMISVVGKVTTDRSFTSWISSNRHTVGPLVASGAEDKESMFNRELQALMAITWIIRLGGLLACWIGLQMLAGPLAVLPDVVPCVGPCLGNMVGGVLCCATFGIALCLGLMDMAIAWLFYRPLIAVPLFIGSAAGLLWFFYFRRRQAKDHESQYEPIPTEQLSGSYAQQGSTGYSGQYPGSYNYPYPPAQGQQPPAWGQQYHPSTTPYPPADPGYAMPQPTTPYDPTSTYGNPPAYVPYNQNPAYPNTQPGYPSGGYAQQYGQPAGGYSQQPYGAAGNNGPGYSGR